jgi:hypothetical protein
MQWRAKSRAAIFCWISNPGKVSIPVQLPGSHLFYWIERHAAFSLSPQVFASSKKQQMLEEKVEDADAGLAKLVQKVEGKVENLAHQGKYCASSINCHATCTSQVLGYRIKEHQVHHEHRQDH